MVLMSNSTELGFRYSTPIPTPCVNQTLASIVNAIGEPLVSDNAGRVTRCAESSEPAIKPMPTNARSKVCPADGVDWACTTVVNESTITMVRLKPNVTNLTFLLGERATTHVRLRPASVKSRANHLAMT